MTAHQKTTDAWRASSLNLARLGLALVCVVKIAVGAAPALGHAPLAEKIAIASQHLASAAAPAAEFLQRGELYRLAGEWEAAKADYDRAAALNPALKGLELCRAALSLDQGRYAEAHAALSAVLARIPDDPDSWRLRAQASEALGLPLAAAEDLHHAIEITRDPPVDLYAERSRLLAAAGSRAEALRCLDEGIARLGPIVTLELAAVDLDLDRGNKRGALARLDRVAAQMEHPAKILTRRAEILAVAHDAGGTERARARARAAKRSPVKLSQSALALPSGQGSSGLAYGGPHPARAALAEAVVTRGPYLQIGTPNGVTIRWRTDVASRGRVLYGTVLGGLTSSVQDTALTTEHEIVVTGLVPDQRYYYAIGTDTSVLEGDDTDHTFATSPIPGTPKPTRVWITGDAGTGTLEQLAVRDEWTRYNRGQPADVWLMLGDNAYASGLDSEYQSNLFNVYRTQLRNMVLWPTRGNHDKIYAGPNNDYYDIFSMPKSGQAGGLASGTEAYYSFDYGNIHFICLDSQGSNRSPSMATWVKNDLAATARDWVIAFWHHPPYTKGSHDSDDDLDSGGRMRDMRSNILPIFDSLGVDVVFTGHSHSYERSFLLDRHYGLSTTLAESMKIDSGDGRMGGDGPYSKATLGTGPHEGCVYTVAGNAGHAEPGSLNHPVMVTSLKVLGSMVVDVAGNRLDARFVDHTGAVRDSFTLIKGLPSIRISDFTVLEGDSGTASAAFTVSLSAPSGHPVTVDFATANATATARLDYVGNSGTLTFPAGTTSQTVTVVVNADLLDEPDETFFVDLTNPTNATIADGRGVGTITDDDAPSQQFSLTLSIAGSGSVALNPPGGIYGAGAVVTLTAIPAEGFQFSGWSGQLSGSANPTTITMDAAKNVTATFVPSGSGGQVTYEETKTGGSAASATVSPSATVSTSGSFSFKEELYLAAISTKPNVSVSSVSGLGLNWTLVKAQCSGRNQTRVEVWMAQGTPNGGGTVTATLSAVPKNAAIAVSRYTGAASSNPIGQVTSGNTNGLDGLCLNGVDSDIYSFDLPAVGGAVVYGAATMRARTHTPGEWYVERADFQQGSLGDVASLAVEDRSVATTGTVAVDGSFNHTTEWAVVGAAIAPSGSGGQVTYEETKTGGSAASATVSTSGSFSFKEELYLAAISTKPNVSVSSVSGLGLNWTLVKAQCSGRNQTRVEVWMAQGTPNGGGTVTATLSAVPKNAAIAVSRYTGAASSNPIGQVTSGNTNGLDGLCLNGVDSDIYSFDLPAVGGAVVYGAATMRARTHTPGEWYVERADFQQGSLGDVASLAVEDRSVATTGTVAVDGSFNHTTEWAVVGAEIRPDVPVAAAPVLIASGVTNEVIPKEFALRQNYPNPLTDRTSISFTLPRQGAVSLAIFDVRGRVVRALTQGELPAGVYQVSWDALDNAGNPVASGLYLVQLKGQGFRATRKLLVSR